MPFCAAPSAPKIEHRTSSGVVLGLGTGTPRLSWIVERADPGWHQARAEIEVTTDGRPTSYMLDGDEQVLVAWPAPALKSRERAAVRVRVSDGETWSEWSPATSIEAGLLSEADWTARFVTPVGIGAEGKPSPVLSGTLSIPGDVQSARLYASAHGVYSITVNGIPIDDTVLAPGWTAYEQRLRYHAYDVTDLVRAGDNTIDAQLGNGWWRGYLGYMGQRALYGHQLALLAQLEVTTTDGTVHTLATDETWHARESEIVVDDLYNGQTTDLRRRDVELPTSAVTVVEEDLGRLVAAEGPPMRPTEVLAARRVWTSPSGATLVDFGQNAVGWVRMRVRGLTAGSAVVLRHAEVLENDELGTRPLRAARATDTWVLAGPDEVVLEPSLTLHGFRYAEVTGVPSLRAEDIEFVVIGSDLRRTGWFDSSNELLNRFHENVVWSTRGNFVDIPTDCPQRDERLGWTGDIAVFSPTAAFLFDTAGLLGSWLADLAAEQLPDGSVPHIVPDVNRNALGWTPASAWGDAATFVPWTLYQRTGDLGVLSRQFESMRAWVDKVADLAGPSRLWAGGFQYGDWLDPAAPPEDPYRSKADSDVVATAHFYRSATVVAEAAQLLGKRGEAERYRALAGEIRDSFQSAYVTPLGRVLSDAPTVYALAIEWGLLTAEQQTEAGQRLADLVRANDFRIATGFVGTPVICDALTSTGHNDVAYRLLFQTECPSWLYPVTMGATTIWERWDSMLPDGSINPGEMTSFNHYSLGAVADWLHRTVAGLAPAEPGYRSLVVRPVPTPALTHASARHLTPYGEASVEWRRTHGRLRIAVQVPVGVTASVHLPGADGVVSVGHGRHEWEQADPVGPTARTDWSSAAIRDILDDPQMWAKVADAAVASGHVPDGGMQVARKLARYLDTPARQVAEALAPDDRLPAAQHLRVAAARLLATPMISVGAGFRTPGD